MPQIAQLTGNNWYLISQIFWLVLVFGAVFFVIGRGMLPKVESTIDRRDAKISDDLAAAKAARDAADAIEEDYRTRSNAARAEAQATIAAAKDKGAKDAEKRLAKANAKIEEKLAAAEQEIAAARTSALTEVESVAKEAAADLVQRLTGKKAAAAAVAQAVKAHVNV
jgi:F-type H+-transporting ATPase subunit b